MAAITEGPRRSNSLVSWEDTQYAPPPHPAASAPPKTGPLPSHLLCVAPRRCRSPRPTLPHPTAPARARSGLIPPPLGTAARAPRSNQAPPNSPISLGSECRLSRRHPRSVGRKSDHGCLTRDVPGNTTQRTPMKHTNSMTLAAPQTVWHRGSNLSRRWCGGWMRHRPRRIPEPRGGVYRPPSVIG